MLAQLNPSYIKLSLFKTYQRLLSYFLFEGRPLTTKGRWLNPLVKAWLSLLLVICKGKTTAAPVFIIGTGRSGTTLLGMLLSMHKKIAFLNEPKIIWQKVNERDDVIGSYSKGEGTFLLNKTDANEKVIAKMNSIFRGFSLLSGASMVVDKYPEIIFRTEYVEKIFPGTHFIFITRNFYDTITSTTQWNKSKGKKSNFQSENWWGLNDRKWILICRELVPGSNLLRGHFNEINLFTDDILRAATEWILTMEKGIELLHLKKNILHIKYEDLTNDSHSIKRIFSFLNLADDEKVEVYASKILVNKSAKNHSIALPPFLEQAALKLLKELHY